MCHLPKLWKWAWSWWKYDGQHQQWHVIKYNNIFVLLMIIVHFIQMLMMQLYYVHHLIHWLYHGVIGEGFGAEFTVEEMTIARKMATCGMKWRRDHQWLSACGRKLRARASCPFRFFRKSWVHWVHDHKHGLHRKKGISSYSFSMNVHMLLTQTCFHITFCTKELFRLWWSLLLGKIMRIRLQHTGLEFHS